MKSTDNLNIQEVLEKLRLHPIQRENSPNYTAHCPADRTHHMIADSNKNQWVCNQCKISGTILDLKYHDSLNGVKSLNERMKKELDQFNELAGSEFTSYEISESLLQNITDNKQKGLMIKMIEIKETFHQKFRLLDQYRLSVMNRDLSEGKELNDDIKAWWTNRY